MSGGSLEYLCYKISYAIDTMQEFVLNGEFTTWPDGTVETTPYHPFKLKHYQRFIRHLRKVEKVLHDIEWAMSGDIDIEDADRTVKKFLNSIKRRDK